MYSIVFILHIDTVLVVVLNGKSVEHLSLKKIFEFFRKFAEYIYAASANTQNHHYNHCQ